MVMQGGKLLLHWSAQFGDAKLCGRYLQSHPLVDPQDERGNTPLHLAVCNDRRCVIAPLRQLADPAGVFMSIVSMLDTILSRQTHGILSSLDNSKIQIIPKLGSKSTCPRPRWRQTVCFLSAQENVPLQQLEDAEIHGPFAIGHADPVLPWSRRLHDGIMAMSKEESSSRSWKSGSL